MRRFTRAFAYALLVFICLGIVSFEFYHSPSQVELRLRSLIGQSLTVPVELEGPRSEPFGAGLQVAGVRIPAAPPLSERTLLTLEDLRVEGARGTAFRRGLRRDPTPPDLQVTRLRVGKARLVLEHERRSLLEDRVGRWNFETLFRPGTTLVDLERTPAYILVDDLAVLVRLIEEGHRPLVWEFSLQAVDARPVAADPEPEKGLAGAERREFGLLLEGDLTEGEFWAGGRLRIEVQSGGVVEATGEIDDFRLLPRHLRLVPEEWAEMCSDLDPAGTVDLTVENMRFSSRDDPAVRILARHYDSAIRLGRGGTRLEHVRGVVLITGDVVQFGRFADLDPVEAELWGVTARLDGLFSPARQRVIITFPETALRDIVFDVGAPAAGQPSGPRHLRELADSVGPTGSIRGEITGDLFTGGGTDWRGTLELSEFSLQAWPWIHDGEGRISVRASEEGRGGDIQIDRLGFARIGTVSGAISYSWDADGIRFAAGGLDVVASRPPPEGQASEGPEPADAGSERASARGTAFGTIGWSWDDGLNELELRWGDLTLDTDLLVARAFAGEVRRSGEEVTGVIECGSAEVPAALFGEEDETWTFERGKGRVLVEDGNVRIPRLKLLGEAWSLRARGKVHVSGDLDFVVVLAPADVYGFRVDDLDDEEPETWRSEAGNDVRMYRITGTMEHPRVRPMGPFDPAVIR